MKIRQGKDIILRWKITTNGEALPLEGRNLTLILSTPNGRERVLSYTTEGDIISTRLFGKEITLLGDYTLTLWENRGDQGQTAVDAVNAFELVKYTTMEEDGSPCGNLEAEVLNLSGDLGVFQQGTTTEKNEQVDKNTVDIAGLQKDITNIKSKEFKTINGEAVVGKGDIKIKGYSNLTWGSTSDMNKIASTGIYVISGTRTSQKDNLPIGNIGTNASISATLLVTESPEGETTYRSIIGQTLILSNAEGHETKIYTRSANKTSYNGGVTYEVTWGEWSVMQGMREVGMTSSYDAYTDNGMYSGVYNNQRGTIETFVLITINDYAVKQQLGQTKAVSQLRYSLNALTQEAEIYSRVGTGEPMNWSDWSSVGTSVDIINDLTTGGADKALSAEQGKVLGMSVAELQECVHDLGDFPSSGAAEAKAAEEAISKNPSISIIHYTVNNATSHIILQDVNGGFTQQVLYYGGHTYIRHIGANLNASWRKTNPTNIKYNQDNHRIALMHMVNQYGEGNNNIDWVELPTASDSIDGLMTMEQVKSLEGKQDQLRTYHETDGYKHVSVGVENVFHVEASCGDKDTRSALLIVDKDETDVAEERTAMLYTENTSNDNYGGNYIRTNKEAVLLRSTHLGTASEVQVSHDKIKMASGGNVIGDVVKEINSKAPKVGYAPDLKVNFAKELVGRGEATEQVIGGIRPTGEISIGDGNATIERIKGRSVVWNQLVDGAIFFTLMSTQDNITYVPTKATAGGNIYHVLGVAKGSHKYLCTGTITNSLGVVPKAGKVPLGTVFSFENEEKMYLSPITGGVTVSTDDWVRIDEPIQFYDLTLMFGAGNEPTTIEDFEARKPVGVSNEYNEGTIISYNGDALKSVGFNAWDEEWAVGAVTTTGYDWPEKTTSIRTNYIPVVPNQTYEISYPSRVTTLQGVMYDKDKNVITGSAFYGNQGKTASITTLPECHYIKVSWIDYLTSDIKDYQHDICIHLTHSGYRNGEYQPYETDTHVLPDVKSILDANGNKLFPYGLLSAGSVHDEITTTKAIKRVGVVDMGTLVWILRGGLFQSRISSFSYKTIGNILCNKYPYVSRSAVENTDKSMSQNVGDSLIVIKDTSYTSASDFKQAMSGVLLYYELATPIEVDLPEPLNMTYEAWDFGTEELLAKGATTPLNADIVYQFNAVDRIRENSSAIDDLEEHVEEHKNDGIELLTNGNLKLTLKGETREFMPATPSGDPMHWAYVSAGAEYNATTSFIVKVNPPWKNLVDPIAYKAQWNLDIVDDNLVQSDSITYNGVSYRYAKDTRTSPTDGTQPRYRIVVKDDTTGKWVWDDTKVLHLPYHWYLNGLGDITNGEIRKIYNIEKRDNSIYLQMIYYGMPIRTATLMAGTYSVADARFSFAFNSNIVVVNLDCLVTFTNSLYNSPNVRHLTTKSRAATLEYQGTNTGKNELSTQAMSTANLSYMKNSLDMSNSPALSRKTILQLINTVFSPSNNPLKKAITLTLHHDAYNRVVDDQEVIDALDTKNEALSANGGKISLVCATHSDEVYPAS